MLSNKSASVLLKKSDAQLKQHPKRLYGSVDEPVEGNIPGPLWRRA